MPSQAPSDPSSERISDEAAHWCMRLHEVDFTEQERERFHQWLGDDPAHQREFDAMMEIWAVSALLPPTAPLQPAPPVRRRARRPWLAAAIMLLGLPLLGLAGWFQGWVPSDYQRYSSSTTLRQVTLPDGSHVQLNLNTQLTFANFRDARSVALNQGEAFFQVRHDASHPFVVDAGRGQVRVTGTEFNVWTYQDEVVVALTEGSVKVLADRRKPDHMAYLSPGMQARFAPQQVLPAISAAPLAEVLAWRDGKLILNDLPLADALPQLNRYLESPVHLADRAIGALRIGGIYNTRDIAGLVQALPRVLPVALARNEAGETVIGPR